MKEISKEQIGELVKRQRAFFANGSSRQIDFRIAHLKKLKTVILQYEEKICAALWADLHKSREEAFLTEISIVLGEIDYHLKHLKRWAKPDWRITPIKLLPSKSRIHYEPLGCALIIAPWNYPFQLLFNPLVGAISSGCTALLKPSPYTPHVAEVMAEIVTKTFESDYITTVQGGRNVNTLLLEERFDLIFFTGSPALGKVVMQAASRYLTPVVLELGGKSPCIVDAGAAVDLAAKRIAWGKSINAGQTCIAPDYLFIHYTLKEEFIQKYGEAIASMYGAEVAQSPYYPRIVNDQAMTRLMNLMQSGRVVYGGSTDTSTRFIAPTLLDDIKPDLPIMQEEIFGPLLPMMTFNSLQRVADFVNEGEKPLALYYFGPPSKGRDMIAKSSSGGGCINDTLMHIANHHLPFGGVGNSGMGSYHGKLSFLAFSHARGFVSTPTGVDLPFRYPPFRYFQWVRKIL
ncbi:MAG: aldehyde dehydrogenase [Marinilabiliales bacterium]|nr:aldehyde dehydrogenase [Marinilabiliales bacterium]